MHAPDIPASTPHRKTRYQRVLMVFALLFLALQLVGAVSHNHAYTQHEPDCAACFVADLPAGGPPSIAMAPAPLPLQTSLPVLTPRETVRAAQTSYLTPPSHAPPGVAVSSI